MTKKTRIARQSFHVELVTKKVCEAAVLFAKGFAKGAAVRSGPTCFACHVTLLDMCSHPCTCGHAVSHTFDVSHSSLGL